MNKRFNVADAAKVLRRTHEAGIRPVTNWIIGFPTESTYDFLKTLLFVFRNRKYIDIGPPWGSPSVIHPHTELDINHRKFGIVNIRNGYDWYTKYRRNNYTIRRMRVALFRKLTSLLNIQV
jgi:radical SAM superfamily enzyme YgiQ (UPF0313 family)